MSLDQDGLGQQEEFEQQEDSKEGLEYKAERFRQQDCFLQPSQYLVNCAKESQASMIQTYQGLFMFVLDLIHIWTLTEIFENLFLALKFENYEIIEKTNLRFEK